MTLSPNNIFEKPLAEFKKDSLQPQNSNLNTTARTGSGVHPFIAYGCNSYMSGDYGGPGYHRYPADTIDVSSADLGSTITVPVNSYDVPNRFTIYDSSGNVVAYTGWMGHANYSGPWGSSLNTTEAQNLKFHYCTSSKFTLVVETVVESYSDSWNAGTSCAYVPDVVIGNYTNSTVSTNMQNAFDTLHVDLSKLSAHLGLSDTLKASDIDFSNLQLSYDKNDPDSVRVVNAPFKSNSGTSTHIYDFSFPLADVNFEYPYINEATHGDSLNIYNLSEGIIITITNYTSSSPTFFVDSSRSFMEHGYDRLQRPCGQTTVDCVGYNYTKRGWFSIFLGMSTIIDEGLTTAVVAATCATVCCILKN